MNKKGVNLPIKTIVEGIIAVTVVALVMFGSSTLNIIGVVKSIPSAFGFNGDHPLEQIECSKKKDAGYFWCEKATEKSGECMLWGDIGEEGQNCDPKNYRPIKYQGIYDICKENCKVQYCETGKGRIDVNKCGYCQDAGKECEGSLVSGWAGNCCAQDLLECKDKGILGLGRGKCKPKATVKT